MSNGIELAPLVCEIQANLDDYNKGIDEANTKGSELEKQFKELSNEARLNESSFKLASAGAELLGKKTGVLTVKQNELTEKLKTQSKVVELTRKAFNNAEEVLKKYSEKSEVLKRNISELNKNHEKAKKVYGENSKEVKELDSKLNALNNEYKENEANINRATNEINEYKIKLNDTQTELLQTQKALKDTNKEIKKTNVENITKKLDKASKKLTEVGSTLTTHVTLPLATAAVASFKFASDLNENVNKTEVVFKENKDTLLDWSKTSLESMGMCQSSALEMASKFGDMGSSMGITSKQTMEYSMNLTQLSADLASFKNISIDRANEALTGVYTGETEALKGLGIVMTQTNLQQFAENQGIKKKIQDMTQAEQVQLRYNYVMAKTKDAQGDFARTGDQAANATRTFWESTKELGATIGNDLLPMVTPLINKVNEAIKSFSKMDDTTKNLIIKSGMVAIAAGPVLSILGKGVGLVSKLTPLIAGASTATTGATLATTGATASLGALSSVALPLVAVIGAVAGGVYLFTKNTELMNGSCLKSREELGLVGNALELLHGDIALSADEMNRLNIKHKEWSDKISPETQKALTETSDKIAKLNYELESTNGLDGAISQEQIDGFKKRTDDLFNETIEKIKQRAPETQKAMAESFMADDGKLDENEKKLEEFFNQSQQKQIEEVQKYQNEKNAILAKAAEEKRDLTQDELNRIQELVIEAGNVNLNNTVKNQQELIAAQADFNARMKNLDMNGLSSLLAEKAKARDKEVESIRQNYDKQIEELKLYRPQMNAEQQKACDDQIAKLEKLKEDGISNERKKYQGFLDEAMTKYPLLSGYINTATGEIMSDEEQNNHKRLLSYAKNMDQMMGITQTGYYQVYSETDKRMHDCYVEVDKSSGQITGVWDNTTQSVYGNPIKAREAIDEDLKNGQKFQPIADSYDGKKQEIWNNAIKVQSEENQNLFDWVSRAWNGAKKFLADNPLNFQGVSVGAMSHYKYNGLDDVPYDGYLARLHKGERVLTAEENANYNKGNGDVNVTNNFYGRVDSPYEISKATRRSWEDVRFV